MLKRNDLAKQFELVVQQEIINHNQQILASNLSINEMKKFIEDSIKKQDFINIQFSSSLSGINRVVFEFSEVMIDLRKKIASISNEKNDYKITVKGILETCVENHSLLLSKFENSEKLIGNLYKLVNDLSNSVVGLSLTFSQEMQDEVRKLRQEIDKSKKEILSQPSEAKDVKKELDKKFEISQVDIQGLKKEIDLLKKSAFIREKHIEHLFTQIERLKVGKL